MRKEWVLRNTLKGTFYENVKVDSFKVNSVFDDVVPGTEVGVKMIKKGEVVFFFDDDLYKIVVDKGFFSLFYKSGDEWFPGSSRYIGTRVINRDGVYYPAETPAGIMSKELKKRKEPGKKGGGS